MYVISSSIDTDEPIMLINNVIGSTSDGTGGYIDGALFQQELMELDSMGYKSIQIHINSVGGNVMEGYNICGAILKSKTPVDTVCVGIAASMAGAIFMCGRKRIMMDYGTLMIHNPFGGTDKKQLSSMRDSLVTMISAKCSLTKDQVGYLCDRETWISASECLAQGFCTEIEVTKKSNQKRMPLEAGVNAMWKEANLVYNNILNTGNMETATAKAIGVSLIANFLDLNSEATENAVLTEVKTRINKEIMARGTAEDNLAKMKKMLDDSEAKFNGLQEKYNGMVAEMDAKAKKDKEELATAEAKAKKDKEEATAAVAKAELETKTTEAKVMVEAFVTSKKIKAESLQGWVDTALKIGIKEAKALIEDVPLNQTAASATGAAKTNAGADTTVTAAAAGGTNAMALMAQVNAKNKKKVA